MGWGRRDETFHAQEELVRLEELSRCLVCRGPFHLSQERAEDRSRRGKVPAIGQRPCASSLLFGAREQVIAVGFGLERTIAPKAGRALLFQHRILHEATRVEAGEKLVLRTDILYGP